MDIKTVILSAVISFMKIAFVPPLFLHSDKSNRCVRNEKHKYNLSQYKTVGKIDVNVSTMYYLQILVCSVQQKKKQIKWNSILFYFTLLH